MRALTRHEDTAYADPVHTPLLALLHGCAGTPGQAALVPAPAELELAEGSWELSERSRVVATGDAAPVAELLVASLADSTGWQLERAEAGAGRRDIELLLDTGLQQLGDEGYTLEVARGGVSIVAPTPAGLFYGTQTLRQLLPALGGPWTLPRLTITDTPRFPWRGYMLDVARHFFGVDEVKRIIDQLALHKLNRLHLHLTDDQGWRIEILSWPALTTVGGSTEVGGGPGGFYTQQEYAELVAYAAARHVTVVPELDMPGHCNAALASYGELNPDGQPTELYTGTSVGFSSLQVGDPVTETFVRDVLGEVAALTPGAWLHVGGDETAATSEEDYASFLHWVQGVVHELGKTMIGWDEVGQVALGAPLVVQHWRHEEHVVAAAERGAQVLSSPAEHAYLDMMYDGDSEVGAFWAGFTTLQDAYRWDPVPEGLDEGQVLGVEGPLWTETVATREHLDYLTWPRLAALAELGWSPEAALSWESFRERMAVHGERLEALGVAFHRTDEVDW